VSPQLTISVVAFVAPTITSAASATFASGQSGTFTITTAGQPTPSVRESGPMPQGISVVDNGDGTASVRGTTPWGTSSSFTITAFNGQTTSQNITLLVTSPPDITSDPPSAPLEGLPYGYGFTTSGSPAPTFSLAAGSLPPGLTLDATGGL
jgi:large repetitive protein